MKVYTDEDVVGVAIGGKGDKTVIVVFDIVEGEAPFEIYKNGAWESYDIESAPEEAMTHLEEANEALAEGDELYISDLPDEIKELVRGHISDELLEETEEDIE